MDGLNVLAARHAPLCVFAAWRLCVKQQRAVWRGDRETFNAESPRRKDAKRGVGRREDRCGTQGRAMLRFRLVQISEDSGRVPREAGRVKCGKEETRRSGFPA